MISRCARVAAILLVTCLVAMPARSESLPEQVNKLKRELETVKQTVPEFRDCTYSATFPFTKDSASRGAGNDPNAILPATYSQFEVQTGAPTSGIVLMSLSWFPSAKEPAKRMMFQHVQQIHLDVGQSPNFNIGFLVTEDFRMLESLPITFHVIWAATNAEAKKQLSAHCAPGKIVPASIKRLSP